MKHSFFLTFSLFSPWLKCKAILPFYFPFALYHTVPLCRQTAISELRRRWNQTGANQATSSWHLPSSFHLPFGLELFPPWHVPCPQIKAGPLVGSPLCIQPAHPCGCSPFRYWGKSQSSLYNLLSRLREGIDMYLYSYFNLDNRGGGLSTQRYGLCTPRKGSWYPFYRELDGSVWTSVGTFAHIGIRLPDRLHRTKESVYRLRYTNTFCYRLRFKFAESTGLFTC